jgi:hypothetical protein
MPSSWTILVVHADNVMNNPVDFMPVLRSNLYSSLLENLFKMSKIASHNKIPKSKSACAFVNLSQVIRLFRFRGTSIHIISPYPKFAKIMGVMRELDFNGKF